MEFRRIPDALRIPINADLVAYLEENRPSAHSDLVDAFAAAVGPDASDEWFVASRDYGYAVVCDDANRIYAALIGMAAIWLRVGTELAPRALAEGAETIPALSSAWVSIPMFQSRVPEYAKLLEKWLRVARRG